MSNLLLDDRAVVLQPSLVRRLGLLEAAITQQLHYWAKRATCVHDGQRWVYKTYADWGDEIGVSGKMARGALDRLRTAGVVYAIQNPTDLRDRTLWWRIDYEVLNGSPDPAPPGSPEDCPPGQGPSAPNGTSRAPVPSRPSDASGEGEAEMTTESTARERANLELVHPSTTVSKPVKYRGKVVPPHVVRGAGVLLDVFNEVTGRDLGSRKADGSLSPASTQIVGAMLARPNVPAARWEEALRRTAAAPPEWVRGPLQIGHVFGERAAEWALAPPGQAGDTPAVARGDKLLAAMVEGLRA